jgi:putative SOS response-associated peptidase YedK
MPVTLPEDQYGAWLSGGAGKEILVPFSAKKMNAWAISPCVNSPKNDDKSDLTRRESSLEDKAKSRGTGRSQVKVATRAN